MKPTFKLSLLCAALSLGACSVFEGNKVDYKNASKPTQLAVPPDLTQLSKDSRYTVINGAVSAAGMKATAGTAEAAAAAKTMVPTALGDVRMERVGNQRWLVVRRSPEALWGPLKEFWQENGFSVAVEQKDLGIMETDWQENRAKIPQDFLRNALSKVFDNLYSSPERYRFKVRMDRNAAGETEVFVTQRTMVEMYVTETKDRTVWQAGAPDLQTEAEFLTRLMRKLGLSADQASQMVAGTEGRTLATVTGPAGQAHGLTIADGFDGSWRRIGLALDRSGFTVEDRDRSKGVYFVRYAYTNADGSEPGFFKKLLSFNFSDSKDPKAEKYQIVLNAEGSITKLVVKNAKGEVDTSETAQNMVKVLANDLK